MPPDDAGGGLVAAGVAEDGRGPGAGAGAPAPAPLAGAAPPALVEEGDVLLPREADEHRQPVRAGEVEQPARRHRVDAHRVDARRAHLREVAFDHVRRGIARPVRARRERAIGHAAQVELLSPAEQVFALDVYSSVSRLVVRARRLAFHPWITSVDARPCRPRRREDGWGGLLSGSIRAAVAPPPSTRGARTARPAPAAPRPGCRAAPRKRRARRAARPARSPAARAPAAPATAPPRARSARRRARS